MKNNCYVDFHVIQTVPPSCVNRDDTGSPKTATYGGVTRARVSSQAWKRAMRIMFKDFYESKDLGVRTKRIPEFVYSKVIEEIKTQNMELELANDSEKLKSDILFFINKAFNLKEKSTEEKLDVLVFINDHQTRCLAKLYMEKVKEYGSIEQYYKELKDDKKRKKFSNELKEKVKEVGKEHPSIDMALFGRMLASMPALNYDAAAQVAHAISTHEVQTEYDYFTAVDDLAPEDSVGAAHLDTNEFNSSTLYRFASINVNELANHLEKDTPEAVKNFAHAFISSMPEGKQKSYGNRTPQDLIYITIRDDQPVNLCGAFEKAVPASSEGYVIPSIQRLDEYANKVYDDFVNKPKKSYAVGNDDVFKDDTHHIHLKELFDSLKNDIEDYQKQV